MPISRERALRPEIFFKDILEKESIDAKTRIFYRAQVISVDLSGGFLQNPLGQGVVSSTDKSGNRRDYKALIGPENPVGSIKARILNDRIDSLIDDKQTKIFWPMFSADIFSSVPLVGEHILVTYETDSDDHGYWISRVPGHDNVNFFEGKNSYKSSHNESSSAMDSFEQPEKPNLSDKEASEAPNEDLIGLFE